MGCNCGGGGGGGGVAAAWAAPVAATPGRKFEVTYPNSVVVRFDQEWQAAQATALSGGTMKIIEAGGDTPDGAPGAGSAGGG